MYENELAQENNLYKEIRYEIRNTIKQRVKDGEFISELDATHIENEIMDIMKNVQNEIEPIHNTIERIIDNTINVNRTNNNCGFCKKSTYLIDHSFTSKLTLVNGDPMELFTKLRFENYDPKHKPQLDIHYGACALDKSAISSQWSYGIDINFCPNCGEDLVEHKSLLDRAIENEFKEVFETNYADTEEKELSNDELEQLTEMFHNEEYLWEQIFTVMKDNIKDVIKNRPITR